MKLLFVLLIFAGKLAIPGLAVDFEAPVVPESGENFMPDVSGNFWDDLWNLVRNVIERIQPNIHEALSVSIEIICIVLLISIIHLFSENTKFSVMLAATSSIVIILFTKADAMIRLASDMIWEMSEYGKLLFPVMTAALAAQGGISTSASMYTGVTVFSSILCALISQIFLPALYVYLCLSAANSALGEDMIKNLRDVIKQLISWGLKILLTAFTTYISISGAVSSATDAAALKATKVTIASFVPVIGGILSDASEAVLTGVSMAKNAAGVYGVIAIFAVFLDPFIRIGVQYLALKITCGICSIFGVKQISGLIGDFSSAMGLLLAMTGAVCILLLVSTICFMRGIS